MKRKRDGFVPLGEVAEAKDRLRYWATPPAIDYEKIALWKEAEELGLPWSWSDGKDILKDRIARAKK